MGGPGIKLPEFIDVDGVQRPTTNSRSEPIAATKEGACGFWEWFGSSQAVDAEGRPLVVYHGTTEDFSEFRDSLQGMYFTPDEGIARTYGTGSSISAYLSLQRPLVIDAKGRFWNELDCWGDRTVDDLMERTGRRILTLNHLKRAAELEGFDGAIVRNVVDNGGASDQYIAFRPDQIKRTMSSHGASDKLWSSHRRQGLRFA